MTELHDLLTRYVADHPPAAGFTDRLVEAAQAAPVRRSRTPYLVAAAVVAVLVSAGVVAAVRPRADHPTTTTTFLVATCPQVDVRQVPAKPVGFDGSTRLVPNETPLSAMVCQYNSGTLVGAKLMAEASLSALGTALTWTPRSPAADCAHTVSLQPDYLIGLTYRNRQVWVSAPSLFCSGTTNGVFSTATTLPVTSWFYAGRYVATPINRCVADAGRFGDDTSLVPNGPVSVTVCRSQPPERTIRTSTTLTAAVRAELMKIGAGPNGQRCALGPPLEYIISFDYAEGPPAFVVYNPSCQPSISNGKLSGNATTALAPLLRTILAQK